MSEYGSEQIKMKVVLGKWRQRTKWKTGRSQCPVDVISSGALGVPSAKVVTRCCLTTEGPARAKETVARFEQRLGKGVEGLRWPPTRKKK